MPVSDFGIKDFETSYVHRENFFFFKIISPLIQNGTEKVLFSCCVQEKGNSIFMGIIFVFPKFRPLIPSVCTKWGFLILQPQSDCRLLVELLSNSWG